VVTFSDSAAELTRMYIVPGRSRPATITVTAHMAHGGKAACPVIMPILTLGSTLDAKDVPGANESAWAWTAMAETLTRVGPQLDSIGIKGVFEGSEVITWDKLTAFAKKTAIAPKPIPNAESGGAR
jgi:hypothetical protein